MLKFWKKYKKEELNTVFRTIGIALLAGLGAGYLLVYKKVDWLFCLIEIS